MEPSWGRFYRVGRGLNFLPSMSVEVENPEIIEICEVFASKYDEILPDNLGNMVCSLPWTHFVITRLDWFPFFGFPIQSVNWVETLLSLSPAGKQYQLIVGLIVVESGIWSGFWDVSRGFVVLPFEGNGAEDPEIVHIVRVYVIIWITGISPEHNEIVSDDTAAVTPSFSGFAGVERLYFMPVKFLHGIQNKYS